MEFANCKNVLVTDFGAKFQRGPCLLPILKAERLTCIYSVC
jgi:hypothetical protein